jgi:hypothetical protein
MKEVFCESGIYGREKEPTAAFVTNVFEQKSKMREKDNSENGHIR